MRAAAGIAALLLSAPAMAIDVAPLWDYDKPALSEERFRAALATAQGDDALILKTQIARTHGLRRDFVRARAVLAEVEPQLAKAGPEAQARYWLELGRTWASAAHKPDELTPQAKAQARQAYDRALAIARAEQLDALAIDTLHMYAFIDTDAADGIKWADEGLKIALASWQPAAAGWEATLRNNRGYALHQLGRSDEALAEFKRSLAAAERNGKTTPIRIAHWMIAMTLRELGRLDEAKAIQLRLEREWDADGEPDPYVFEELEKIYRAQGDAERADHYAARLKATQNR
ncbi:MAG TPA: tetratricopeptide repeat protein [Burkholderiaceae bacterium]|nr:tetratricopeptide repeat protein [Burkholderiaceae bacterium]